MGTIAGLRAALILLCGPILALVAMDRAVVLWGAHWSWVAREVPPLTLDPYRLEGVLRSTPPDPHGVLVIGNSIAETGVDAAALDERFASDGLHFVKATVGGSPALTFGMLAPVLADLSPRAVVYVSSAAALGSGRNLDHVYTYDARAVPELMGWSAVLAAPRAHLGALVGELHVFARHRRAMRNALLVRLGELDWRTLRERADRVRLQHVLEGSDVWQTWLRDTSPDHYPNANTRSLSRIVRLLRERGSELVVVDAPVHPSPILIAARARIEAYRAELRDLSETEGFELLPAAALPEFRGTHFTDFVHLNPRGAERFTGALGDFLARHWEARP